MNVAVIKNKVLHTIRSKNLPTSKKREYIIAYIFLAPWIIGLLTFTLWPFLNSFIMSFQRTNLFASEFIGLSNYKAMFSDERFYKSMYVTIKYVVISVPLKLTFALFIAMLLNDNIKGVNMYRTILYIPSLIGGSVAVAAMWSQLFGTNGLVSSILEIFGKKETGWIANPSTALYVLVILTVWQFGSSMVIFLAGLKNIPTSLYEACMIDGGGRIANFLYITLPMLSPIILFNFILQMIGAFQVFTQSYLITRGGPMDETNFMVLYIYNKGFMESNMGYASALSWVLLAIIAIVTGLFFLTSRYWVYYEDN